MSRSFGHWPHSFPLSVMFVSCSNYVSSKNGLYSTKSVTVNVLCVLPAYSRFSAPSQEGKDCLVFPTTSFLTKGRNFPAFRSYCGRENGREAYEISELCCVIARMHNKYSEGEYDVANWIWCPSSFTERERTLRSGEQPVALSHLHVSRRLWPSGRLRDATFSVLGSPYARTSSKGRKGGVQRDAD